MEEVRRCIGKTVAEGNSYDLLTGYKIVIFLSQIKSITWIKDTKNIKGGKME